ncbi:VacB/RNase II family 3'-5' exoribonuclease [Halieaceae bacterium IMCC14734]|uniref:exoribonuclease II n=1 Tax=Candidatus Litorirhabdus singularis TaxID=2518993 RepID=A0ABT3TKC5_9GAMM|nr:VacB/RNase II family 3'-5' exoribonuclease [Candidatus Litorirhabdus singularis]MCX2982680.1 VacB/RNase II family 3'-5' exoribonuclease [Candidatus Litorirhabdus singularis]
MLNKDSLSQLKGLKDQMVAEKEHADATVKGTHSRYGFAVLADGREIFIPPDEMLKAFPDDRVRVCIRPDKGDKLVADIERLIDCPIGVFTGRCVRKGKALFVEPDLPRVSRWLFLPPHARNGVKEGDYVTSAVLRHPIKDGRPQAKVLRVLGASDSPGIENALVEAKYELPREWSSEASAELEQQLAKVKPLEQQRRRDLTDLEFVSIDSARTQDIDDALYAESNSEGWFLYVAIADPGTYIEPGSLLEQEIAARGTSVYFHGDAIAMMPERLSQETCALAEDQLRPALVCKISVTDEGAVGHFEFIEATVRSRAKLSYLQVDRYLSGNYDELMSHATPLEALYQVFRALRSHREARELVMEDRTEYRWYMNEHKKIDHIEQHEKLQSQRLVEECMIAANRSCALFLADNGRDGPFVRHDGFRTDRSQEVKKFVAKFLPDFIAKPLDEVANYRAIMKLLAASPAGLPLRSMVNRLLTRAELSTKPGPHMGMALPCYSNCTSPLRKYADFLAHRQIKQVLHDEAEQLVSQEQLKVLQQRVTRARAASMDAEKWLKCVFMQDKVGADYEATISHLNSNGFTVRLLENGIEGVVDLRNVPEKFSYDRWTASLTSGDRQFQLERPVRVKLTKVDAKTREILFSPLQDEPAPSDT